MDMMMPVMDGESAVRTIRQLPRDDARTIPIIAMTANAFEEDIRSALACGMNAHIAKPISPEHLIAEIGHHL
jgi:CheY-like chemotaxis protein